MNRTRFATFALAGLALAASIACTDKAKNNTTNTSSNASAPAAAASPAAASTGSSAATAASAAASSTTASNGGAAASPTLTTATSPVVTSGSTTDVVNALRPSVVRVRTAASQIGPFGSIGNASGTGTGMILDTDGHVLTNNHVVTLGGTSPANKIMVDLADGESVQATLVGREPAADLAVLKISARNLTPVKFADPKSLQVGQDVIAIGYALDLGSTPSVTKGVISALNRQIDETLSGNNNNPFSGGTPNIVGGAIQTDAAINPGNSGGPLVNMQGEVVGVNTAGIFRSDTGEPVSGINFAVSVDTVLPVTKALISTGKVDRGFLGVNLVPITANEAQANSLAVNDGAGVASVVTGSPAAQAGIQAGDVIVKLGNHDIHSVGDIQQALIENGPGTKVTVQFYRGKDKQSVDVTLGSRPAGG
ncbi:MAG TPA: trypsin-like peptidase domain-containing protein [Dehalococcoidia bacterium]|nr:trypsin-like peptidase domain-containing protein [Dehalococcoidia bacterium]